MLHDLTEGISDTISTSLRDYFHSFSLPGATMNPQNNPALFETWGGFWAFIVLCIIAFIVLEELWGEGEGEAEKEEGNQDEK